MTAKHGVVKELLGSIQFCFFNIISIKPYPYKKNWVSLLVIKTKKGYDSRSRFSSSIWKQTLFTFSHSSTQKLDLIISY